MPCPISNLVSKIRAYHESVTLPWMDDGKRMLPAKLYLEYTQQMRGMRDNFNALVDEFYNNYPTLIKEARLKLGTMYDPASTRHPRDPRQVRPRLPLRADPLMRLISASILTPMM